MSAPFAPADGPASAGHHPRSVRTLLTYLVLACLLPGIVGAAAIFCHDYREGRRQLEKDTLQTARALARAVDSQRPEVLAPGQGLATASPTEAFNSLFSGLGLPPGWVAAIVDGSGRLVACSREGEKCTGGKPSPEFLRIDSPADEGILEWIMEDGTPVVSVYSRSPTTRWSVVVNIPLDTLKAQLFRRLALLALGVALLFAAGIALAGYVAGKIARAFLALRIPALALGTGAFPVLPPTEVREADEVARALGEAAALLRDRTAALLAREDELARRNAALRQSEIRLQALTRHAPAAIAIFDREMRYLAVSRRWCEDFRLAGEDVIGRSHYDIFPDISERWKEIHRRGLAGEVLSEKADRFERADGTVHWVHWELWPWQDDTGAVGGVVIASEDITRQKAVEVALQESESRFRLMADYAPVLIWLAGVDRLCNWFNRPWLAFTGRTLEEELGTGWAEGVHPDDRTRCLAAYGQSFERRECFVLEYRLRRHDGEYRWIIDHGAPRFEADGTFAGYVGACIDITDMKEAREVAERLNTELEHRVRERTAELLAANRELESFTFAASHDLRGPLGRINTFSALLERQYRDRLEGNGLQYLDFIRQNAVRLTHLVDDLLLHARIAQQDLALQPLDVAAITHAVLREKAEDIREVGARVSLDLAAAAMGEPHALQQALGNVLENALKYSARADPPAIEIGGRVEADRYRLWVRDNGIGFDMGYHDKIFEMFRRLHTYGEYPGTGVGLALVKRAMERMDGRVWAESAPGRGATFFLEFRLAPAETAA